MSEAPRDPLEPPYGARDGGGMAARIAGIAGQIDAGLEAVASAPWRLPLRDPDLLAVGGLGGSAIAADLCAGLYADRLPRPLLVVRDERWPACVSARSLALLSSCSGDTAETLALYAAAAERGVPRLVLTRGGALGERARRDGVGVWRLHGDGPPRAALFSGWVPLVALLHALGWIDDPAPEWCEAAAETRAADPSLGAASPPAANPAKRLARSLAGRVVFLYSGPGAGAAAARRWRQQLNENAKLLGHSAVVPELNHNEIVGWEKSGPMSREPAVLLLRDREESPEVTRRLDLTGEMARSMGADVHEWHSVGEGRLARIASLVQFGDYLSFYLALLNGVDPTPVTSIDEFKRRLSAR